MSIIYKQFNSTNIIIQNQYKNLQEVVNQFMDCGLKKLIYWRHRRVLFMECTENDKIDNAYEHYTKLPDLKDSPAVNCFFPDDEFYDILIRRGLFIEIDKSPKAFQNCILNASSLSDQITSFYNFYRISEYDLKLRKCYANFISSILQNRYPDLNIEIIGSTTSGLGKFNSDLDMTVVYDEKKNNNNNSKNVDILKNISRDLKSNLMYEINPSVYNCLHPICNYFDHLLDVNIDISCSNDSCLQMNRLLRQICECCDYFAPLCMFIKQIYLSQSVIHERPNPFFTGFKIVSLIIYFLQSKNLLSGLQKIDIFNDRNQENPQKLERLLIDFYRFIIDFEPNIFIIDLGEGRLRRKEKWNPFLVCYSPLIPTQNITRNIGKLEWNRFVDITKNILSQIENCNNKNNNSPNSSSQLSEIW